MKRSLSILILLCSVGFANAQTGIRFTFLDFDQISTNWRPDILVGFDKNLGDRLSIGVDVVKGFRFDQNDDDFYAMNTWGIQYRSQYFFGSSVYIGSTIGFRRIALSVNPDPFGTYYSVYGTSPAFIPTRDLTIVPVGIRLGLRSELDGWYQDLYAGVGYNLNAPTELSSAWINLGYAFGIGW